MTELTALAIAGVGVLLGALLQGVIGFGFAFIAVPVLGLVMPNRLPQVILLCAAPLVVTAAWHERRAISLSGVGWTLTGKLVGVVPGLLLLSWMTIAQLQVLIGLVTIATATLQWRSRGRVAAPSPALCVGAGIASGVMTTAVGMGGPPLALLYSSRPQSELRSTLATIFVVGNTASISSLALAGRIRLGDLIVASILLVPLVSGLMISRRFVRHISASQLTSPVLVLVVVIGCVLLFQGLI